MARHHSLSLKRLLKWSFFSADDRGEDAPSRQKKNERRTPRRRKTTTEATSSSQTSEFLTVN
uniref:Uncharacterized protein n=1 Tax=Salix viminalis TaxID=40686 RepID=A0A6N2M2C6_SALVM